MTPTPLITYQLFIEVAEPVTVVVGRFGCFEFPAGNYIYTGSAKKNMQARIARHLRRDKKLRWHIDYLLHQSPVCVTEVKRFTAAECAVNRQVQVQLWQTVLVPAIALLPAVVI